MSTLAKPYVIGINGSFHDAAVCVLSAEMNEPVMLLSEDRHSGISHHFGFPFKSLKLAIEQIGAENISAVAYSRDRNCFKFPPQSYFEGSFDAKTERRLRHELATILNRSDEAFPHIDFLPEKIKGLISGLPSASDNLSLRKNICYLLVRYLNELATEINISRFLPTVPITGFRHHDTHAATYFASPFDNAAIVTWDGRGEFDSTVLTHGKGEKMVRVAEIQHPLSIGTFYEVFAEYVGFSRIEGPGKLMGLAAYGDNRFVSIIDQLIKVDNKQFDFTFNDELLSYSQSQRLNFKKLLIKIIGPKRKDDESINDRHMAIAYAVQKTTERVCAQLVKNACKMLNTRNVVFSGGLSLNCVMNEKLRAKLKIKPFLIPPCGDDGTALGAALLLRHNELNGNQRAKREKRLRYFNNYGTRNDPQQIKKFLDKKGFKYTDFTPKNVASLIAKGNVIGYMSGRYEFGPRALGFRSILADPRPYENWPRVNKTIKHREDFRPFAPVMLKQEAEKYWGNESEVTDSPYMLLAPRMNNEARDCLGAVIHHDLTARVQTLEQDFNPKLFSILNEFKQQTGVGVLMNTSLNMSGESIIIDFADLLRFMAYSEMDAVVLDNTIVERSGNENCLAELVTDLPNRQDYLKHRRKAYQLEWKNLKELFKYTDYDDFFYFLYSENMP